MTRSPGQAVTAEIIADYARDGVVCIRDVVSADWIERLGAAWERIKRQAREQGLAGLMPRSFLDADPLLAEELGDLWSATALEAKYARNAPSNGAKYMSLWDADFRAFALEGPVAELVGLTLGCDTVRFFWDQMFEKRAGGDLDTYWHTDQGTWPTKGEHLPSVWIPLTPISESQSLEYIAGSHVDRTEYWGRSWNAMRAVAAGTRPADRPDFIDYETRRGEPNVRFLKWAMEPGDVMVFHPRLYHGGGPNKNPDRPRIALSTRWFGDDITWNPRNGDVNVPGAPLALMRPGDKPSEALFPIVWRRGPAANAA